MYPIQEVSTESGMNSLVNLNKRVIQCTKCSLRESATAPVPGIGKVGAKYFIIGESPGEQEDKQGIPFIGLAGKRLNELLALAGIDQNDCYITNICRCRPPENRQPRKTEIRTCQPFLMEEIALIKPQYIITLGAIPLSLFSTLGIKQLHGTMQEIEIEEQE